MSKLPTLELIYSMIDIGIKYVPWCAGIGQNLGKLLAES